MNSRHPFLMIFVCLSAAGVSACTSHEEFLKNYKQAVLSGFDQIPESLEIEELYGQGDGAISHFISSKNRNGYHDWSTSAYFGGRYWLSMKVDVEVNHDFSKVLQVIGEPTFHIFEVRHVKMHSDGLPETSFIGKNEVKFEKNQWKKLYESGGDVTVVGMPPNTNPPVEGFDDFVKGQLKDRIDIRPHHRQLID